VALLNNLLLSGKPYSAGIEKRERATVCSVGSRASFLAIGAAAIFLAVTPALAIHVNEGDIVRAEFDLANPPPYSASTFALNFGPSSPLLPGTVILMTAHSDDIPTIPELTFTRTFAATMSQALFDFTLVNPSYSVFLVLLHGEFDLDSASTIYSYGNPLAATEFGRLRIVGTADIDPVPLPATLGLFASGLAAIAFVARRRKRTSLAA
jgi:hypothetical protein